MNMAIVASFTLFLGMLGMVKALGLFLLLVLVVVIVGKIVGVLNARMAGTSMDGYSGAVERSI